MNARPAVQRPNWLLIFMRVVLTAVAVLPIVSTAARGDWPTFTYAVLSGTVLLWIVYRKTS